jgi:hypothetical protein
MSKCFVGMLFGLFAANICAQPMGPSAEPTQVNGGIGYPTVQAALDALKAKPGVKLREQQGWIIVADKESEFVSATWSFTPEGNPAHPAAVKRTLYEKNGQIMMETNVLCQAKKEPCDALVRDFEVLGNRIREELNRRSK